MRELFEGTYRGHEEGWISLWREMSWAALVEKESFIRDQDFVSLDVRSFRLDWGRYTLLSRFPPTMLITISPFPPLVKSANARSGFRTCLLADTSSDISRPTTYGNKARQRLQLPPLVIKEPDNERCFVISPWVLAVSVPSQEHELTAFASRECSKLGERADRSLRALAVQEN